MENHGKRDDQESKE